MDNDNETIAMLQFIQELKSSPDYQDIQSENTKRNCDLWEKALSGDTEALIALSISSDINNTIGIVLLPMFSRQFLSKLLQILKIFLAYAPFGGLNKPLSGGYSIKLTNSYFVKNTIAQLKMA